METDFGFSQIRINKQLYLKIKTYCAQTEKKLFEFYDEVMQWFFNELKYNQADMVYRASQNQGCLLTVRLKNTTLAQMQELGNKANISTARIFFTALMLYLEKYPLD